MRAHGGRRRVVSVLGVLALLSGLVLVGGPTGAGAADGRVFEPNDPPNGRDYWLPGDDVVVDVTCLDGEHWVLLTGGSPFGGTLGPDGFEGSIGSEVEPGTYTDTYECVDDDNEVMEEFTVTYEVRSPFRLVATVGTEAGVCADTDEIEVDAGTEVFWCYHLLPDPLRQVDALFFYDNVTHVLADTANGALGSADRGHPASGPANPDAGLPDGGITSIELGLDSSSVADQDMDSTGTWSMTAGYTFYDPDLEEEAWDEFDLPDLTADARVTVVEPDDQTTITIVDPPPAPPPPPATPVAQAPSYTG